MKDIAGHLESKAFEFFKHQMGLKSGEKLVIGVSGGPDSLCLLHLLLAYRRIQKLTIVAAHFNHALRPEADAEEKFVKDICAREDVCFTSHKKQVQECYRGDSLEQAARKLRFDFLFTVCRRHKAKKIVLAHHRDDLVETVLLRIIRGTGLLGLRGILPKNKFRTITVFRPLLGIEKKEILEWLGAYKIAYMTDLSNFDENFLRNKIRLKMLPQLLELNPNIKENIANLAYTVGRDYEFLVGCAERNFNTAVIREHHDRLILDIAALRKLDGALRFLTLRLALERIRGNLRRIELRHIRRIEDFIFDDSAFGEIDLPAVKVKKDNQYLELKRLVHEAFSDQSTR